MAATSDSKQHCPKCGSKQYSVVKIPDVMPHSGTYTHCPVCDGDKAPSPKKTKAKP